MKPFFLSSSPEAKSQITQLTPLFYFGQRESIVADLFLLLGNKKYQCLYDPFAGSGSVSFAAMEEDIASDYSLNDSFPVFKYLWEMIKASPGEFISEYTAYLTNYCAQAKNNRVAFYNRALSDFNHALSSGFYAKSALLFAFLINFADKNMPLFDQQLHLTTQANVFINIEDEKKNLDKFKERTERLHHLLNKYKTNFSSGDFLPCLETASKGDLVILDPPYPAQASNVYYKINEEKILQNNLRIAIKELKKRDVDLVILYGARRVLLENQLNDEELELQHLIRLSTHRTFGYFLDHIYISKNIASQLQQLPPGMAHYDTFFSSESVMTEEQYEKALNTLQHQKEESSPARIASKL